MHSALPFLAHSIEEASPSCRKPIKLPFVPGAHLQCLQSPPAIQHSPAASCLGFIRIWALASHPEPYLALPTHGHNMSDFRHSGDGLAVTDAPSLHSANSPEAACSTPPEGADLCSLEYFCPLLLESIMSSESSLPLWDVAGSYALYAEAFTTVMQDFMVQITYLLTVTAKVTGTLLYFLPQILYLIYP